MNISKKGSPREIGGDFYCNDNQLSSLKGVTKKVGGDFYCTRNKVEFTEEDVRAVCNVKGNVKI